MSLPLVTDPDYEVRLMGLDMSTTALGVCLLTTTRAQFTAGELPDLVYQETIKAPTTLAYYQREGLQPDMEKDDLWLLRIDYLVTERLTPLVRDLAPNLAATERGWGRTNFAVAGMLAHANARVQEVFRLRVAPIPYAPVDGTRATTYLLGPHSAHLFSGTSKHRDDKKAMVQAKVAEMYPGVEFGEDAADAVCVGNYGLYIAFFGVPVKEKTARKRPPKEAATEKTAKGARRKRNQ